MRLQPSALFLFIPLLFGLLACEEDEAPMRLEAEIRTAEDVPANPDAERGDPPSFTFFDLDEGRIIPKSDSNSVTWDLAFSGTTILTNGGVSGPGQGAAMIVDGIFEDVQAAPENGYQTDGAQSLAIPTGSGNGWYTYTGGGNPPNAVLPIPGKVIVLQTGEGNYAKVEILSYYEGNPDTSTPEFADLATRPAGRHYTFRYAVQADGSRNF